MPQKIVNFRVTDFDENVARIAPLLQDRDALQGSGDAFHALADTMPQMVWSTLADGDHDYFNRRWYEYTGVPTGSTDGEGWANVFHADDQPEAWRRWKHSLATGDPYEVEYRLRHQTGEYRWVLGRALPIVNADGEIQRWIGTCTDIHEAKQVAKHNEMLSRELSHRIKNIFAIISGLISMTARSHEGFRQVAQDLRARIAALGRAHEFVRPQGDGGPDDIGGVTLVKLMETIFATYPAFDEGRLTVTGGEIEVGDAAATPLALVLHELATNSIKYGALSTENGTVAVNAIVTPEMVEFYWCENGGPRIESAPERNGFGSQLIDLAIKQQLGGTFERRWLPEGLEVEFSVKSARLGRLDR